MKRIAVSITESEKEISPSMDLCGYYFLVDYKENEIKSVCKVKNPYRNEKEADKLAKFISDQKTKTVITGKLTDNTLKVLNKHDIKVFDNNFGETQQVIKDYINKN